MMPRIALALTVTLASCSAQPEPFRHITFEQALTAAKQEEKIVLIDFFTTWCGPCKKLDATTWKDAQVQDWIAKRCIALKLDAEKTPELAARFQVNAYPTILLLKPDGTVIDRLVGYRDAQTFLSEAKGALAGQDSLSRAKAKLTGHEDDPMARAQVGDELARAGLYEEALAEYLWCFDNGRKSPSYAGVRLSFLLGDIARLGEVYEPAIEALVARRDAAEARLLQDVRELGDASEVAAINRVLNAPERTLALYDRLRNAGPVPGNVKIAFTQEILGPLVSARRYQDALDLFDKPDGYVTGRIRLFEMSQSIPGAADEAVMERAIAFRKLDVVERSSAIYESLLGSGRTLEASKVADILIGFAPAGTTYVSLIEAAARAGVPDTAMAVGQRGLGSLPDQEQKRVEETLARISKPK